MSRTDGMGDDTRDFLERLFRSEALQRRLHATARRHAGNKAAKVDPSDLVVEALLKAARRRDQLKDPDSLEPWVIKILVNEVLAKLRVAEIRTQALPQEDRLPSAKDRQKVDVYGWLKQLSEEDQEVICLCKLSDLPYADVATLYGIKEPALRKRLSRAMERLKEAAARPPREGGVPHE